MASLFNNLLEVLWGAKVATAPVAPETAPAPQSVEDASRAEDERLANIAVLFQEDERAKAAKADTTDPSFPDPDPSSGENSDNFVTERGHAHSSSSAVTG